MTAEPAGDDWGRRALYLAMTDRFADGDARNDDLGEPGCHDASDANRFHGGDIAGVRQRVGYLEELGVGALWITPLPRQVPLRNGACGYHGYWADETLPDDGAMEPKLGTLADVAGLRADLHAAGMKLVVDMVVNHAGRGARITTQAPSFFHDDASCAALGDPVVACSLRGLPDYAQEKPEVARYLTAMSRAWVERVHPDGIRMDTAKHVPPGYFASSLVPAAFLDNHDVPRFLSEAPAGLSDAELSRRYALALVALFTLPEIPQLYQGDELAAVGDGAHNRVDMPAWSWNAATRAGTHAGFVGDAQATWALVQSLAAMRAQDDALWRGTYLELRRQGDGANVIAFERAVDGGTDRVVVVLSNDAASRTVTVPLPGAGAWPDGAVLRDALGLGAPGDVRVAAGAMTIAMPALIAAVYRSSASRIAGGH